MSFKAGLAGMLAMTAVLACAPAVASAQEQSINLNGGFFFVRGESGRTSGDVINENLTYLAFDLKDFNGGTFGGDYSVGLGDYIEAGVGINYYQRTVPSVYLDVVNVNGREIEQDSRLRIIPITAKVSFFPIGRSNPVQPYVGAGVNFYRWNYSEFGEFVDFDNNNEIFRGRFEDSGTTTGATVFGGVRGQVASRYTVGGEVRWQNGKGDLDPEQGFAGDRIDLGGVSLVATFGVRF